MAHKLQDWCMTGDYCKLILSDMLAQNMLRHTHQTSHLGTRKIEALFPCEDLKIIHLKSLVGTIASNYIVLIGPNVQKQCLTCKLTNVHNKPKEKGS